MAASIFKVITISAGGTGTLHNKITKLNCLMIQVRNSRYGPIYMQPLFRKEDSEELLPENDERKFRPIKAAQNEETCSVFYNSLVQKFVNLILKRGKKSQATEIMHKTLANIKHIQVAKYNRSASEDERELVECNPLEILHKAVENCKPILSVTKIPRGGVMYEVPFPCNPKLQEFKAISWMLENCRSMGKRTPVHMDEKLANEILEAYKNQGTTVKNKQDLHKKCEANRAYAHFRWS